MASPLPPNALADLATVLRPWAGMLRESVAARAEAVGLQELVIIASPTGFRLFEREELRGSQRLLGLLRSVPVSPGCAVVVWEAFGATPKSLRHSTVATIVWADFVAALGVHE